MKKSYYLFTALILLFQCSSLLAQEILVKGKIISGSDQEPLPFVSVSVAGSYNGTVTNVNGEFSLTVKPDAVIEVSLIGFKSASQKASADMTFVLESDMLDLDEVVVIGYQAQRKVDLTGAVGIVDMKNPKSESSPNVLNSLQGKVAGVQINTDAAPGGGGTTIRVRGMSTSNNSSPLYVIDGVPTTENLNTLNSSDIESIQVLKDAASASIYGSRAANGVIIITTKKGKNEKLTVNASVNGSLQTVAKQFDVLNSQQWGNAYWQAMSNDGLTPNHPFYGNGSTPVLVDYLDAAKNNPSADTDWQDEVYNPAWSQNYNLSVSNSTKNSSTLFSINYVNQDGLMDYSYFERYSARLNSEYKVNDYIKVGENLMVSNWKDRGYGVSNDRGVPYSAMRQHPAIGVRDINGAYSNPLLLAQSDIDNPVHTLYNGRDNGNDSWRIFGNGYLEVQPIKSLTLKTNLGIEHVQYFNQALSRKLQPSDNNSVSRAYGQGNTITWTNTASYSLNLEKHKATFFGGSEAIAYTFEDISAFRNQYKFEDANYMILNAGEGVQTNSGGKSDWSLYSLFGKVDYSFNDRYLVSGTIRRDATSRLDADSNSGIFPAVSGAWRINNEQFMSNVPLIQNLKLRLGWGQTGNAGIDNYYASYSTYAYDSGNGAYDINGSNTDAVAGVKVSKTGNRDLKWETTTQTNLGLDLGILDGSVSMSFDYYWKNTEDVLSLPPAMAVSGENAEYYMNTGTMKNNGYELAVEYFSPSYGDFSWVGNLNFSHYKNEVVKINDFVTSDGGDVRIMEGQPMGVYYGYVTDGIFQNQAEVLNHADQQGKGVGRLRYRDLNSDGVVNEKDRTVIGDPNPDFSLGLNLDFKYKRFTLSTFFSGDFGFDIYNQTKRQLDFMGYGITNTNRGTSVLDAWTPSNSGASVPALSLRDANNEARMSTYFVEDGSYVKMKYLKANYELNSSVARRIGLETVNVYGQVENVFTITGYSGLDPELPISTFGSRQDVAPYPIARTFSLGVNVSF